MPRPKHPTKTTAAIPQAALTHSHQRVRVSVRLDTGVAWDAGFVAIKCTNENAEEGEQRVGASRIGFTTGFPKEKGGVSWHSRSLSVSMDWVSRPNLLDQHLDEAIAPNVASLLEHGGPDD